MLNSVYNEEETLQKSSINSVQRYFVCKTISPNNLMNIHMHVIKFKEKEFENYGLFKLIMQNGINFISGNITSRSGCFLGYNCINATAWDLIWVYGS